MKLAMIVVQDELKRREYESLMIIQVHDELVFDVPETELEDMQQLLKDKMESVIRLDVPLLIDIEYDRNWKAKL